MISVEEAQDILLNNVTLYSSTEYISLEDTLHRILAIDVIAPISQPPFNQSAMDGYAICISDESPYTLIGEVKAGDPAEISLHKGEAVRIFTGAQVPDTTQAVIAQENVTVLNNKIVIDVPITANSNIRPLGEQIKQGNIALHTGTKLNAAAIGYLASLGITKVEVFTKISVNIVVTGNELITPGNTLSKGSIYESNSMMLKTALEATQNVSCNINIVKDNLQATIDTIKNAIASSDIVVITGGISVGDYDFVSLALEELCVEKLFYKVKQKPGKPLYFGKKEGVAIFALPGNPAAALTCFYNYVYPYIHTSLRNNTAPLSRLHLPSLSTFQKKGNRAQFLKAYYNNNGVTILEGQSSAMLYSYAQANALVYLDEHTSSITKGEVVKTIILP